MFDVTKWPAESKVTKIDETPTTLLTREKMPCGIPRRVRWVFVVRTGYSNVHPHTGVVRTSGTFFGGCMMFDPTNHDDPKAAAQACFDRIKEREG